MTTTRASTTTTLTSISPISAAVGTLVTIQAKITSSVIAGPTPTGTVSFRSGGVDVGVATIQSDGTATFATISLPVGMDIITASYSGDGNYSVSDSASTTITITPSSVTTLTSISPNPTEAGTDVTIVGDVASYTGTGPIPTGTVTFQDGGPTWVTHQYRLMDHSPSTRMHCQPASMPSRPAMVAMAHIPVVPPPR